MTTTGASEKTEAKTLTRWMTDVGALSWLSRAVFPVLFLAGIALRVAGTGRNGADNLITQHAAGLALVILVYAVLVRRGTWSWLAGLCAAPALLDVRALSAEGKPGGAFLVLGVVSLAAILLTWRRPSWAVAASFAAAAVVAALLAPVLPNPRVAEIDSNAALALQVSTWVILATAVAGVLAVAGLGRAAGSALRPAVLVMLAAPVLGTALAPDGGSWIGDVAGDPTTLLWWPAAGVLGVTALLRGRRGRAAARPQSDEVDEAALADFRSRYGTPAFAPVVVVIAAHNEVDGIGGVLDALPSEVLGLATDAVVVDDGSTDGTADVVAAHDSAYLCRPPVNRGQGAALRLGYRIAREHGASYVVTTDADGQYDVEDIPVLLRPLLEDRADFVTGSRVLGQQHTRDRVRRTGVHVFAWIVSLMTGRRITDTSFGLRAMRVEVTERVTLNQPQYQSSELLLGALSHGFRVVEVPATMHVRSAGSTKKGRNLVYGSRYARVVLGTWWREGCHTPAEEPTAAVREEPGRVDA